MRGCDAARRFRIMWADGTVVYEACLRCGREFRNNLKDEDGG